MKTYESDGPVGISVMYLCNGIPSANVTHEQGRTYISVPDEDDAALRDYLGECGYTYSIFKEEPPCK